MTNTYRIQVVAFGDGAGQLTIVGGPVPVAVPFSTAEHFRIARDYVQRIVDLLNRDSDTTVPHVEGPDGCS